MLNIELSCFSVYFLFQICRCKRGGLGGGTDTLKMKKGIVFQWVLQGLSQLQNVTVAPMRCLSGWNSSHCSLGKKVTISNAVCAFEFQKWKSESGSLSLGLKLGDKPGGNLHSQLQSHRMLPLPHLTTPRSKYGSSVTQKPFSGPFNDSNCSLFCPKIHISPYHALCW